MSHFLPELTGSLRALPDRRDPERLYYPKENLTWAALLMFVLGLGSRRQLTLESNSPAFVANLNQVAETHLESAPHDHSLAYYLAPLKAADFERLPVEVVRRLIRMKALDRWRVYGRFLVAVDGTGQFFFTRRHCDHCLTQKRRLQHPEEPRIRPGARLQRQPRGREDRLLLPPSRPRPQPVDPQGQPAAGLRRAVGHLQELPSPPRRRLPHRHPAEGLEPRCRPGHADPLHLAVAL